MSTYATTKVSSPAAAVGARSVACPTTWQAAKSIRVRMHDGNGFLTTRRLKERSSP